MQRIPSAALGPLRRLVDADEAFRALVAADATAGTVDEIGRLWLERPDGWQAQIVELEEAARRAAADAEAVAELKRERKRRAAAEKKRETVENEMAALTERVRALEVELDDARALATKFEERSEELRSELIDTRNEVRHANDRAAASARRVEQLTADLDVARAERGAAEEVRDDVLADRAHATLDMSRVAELGEAARRLADDLASLVHPEVPGSASASGHRGTTEAGERERRRPMSLPGGVVGDSDRATEHLVRSGASILVDGYNVAMLGWPALDLVGQRASLLDAAEALARRFGADITVVFDGSDVVGAATDQRRVVRVAFSPAEVTADDVIRAEVDRLPVDRAVVVVTNDAEIVRDVRAKGANVVSSDRFLGLALR